MEKKQITATIYGKDAQDYANQQKHDLWEANDLARRTTSQHFVSPFADWSVEPVDDGWAVFVTEPS